MTQAANFLDFDWLRRVSNVYELQGLYVTSQSAVVSVTGSSPPAPGSVTNPVLQTV